MFILAVPIAALDCEYASEIPVRPVTLSDTPIYGSAPGIPSIIGFNALQKTDYNYDITSDVITESLAIFDNLPTFSEKMKALCTDEFFSEATKQIILKSIPIQFEMFYRVIGPENIAKFGYQKSKLVEEYQRIIKNENLDELVKAAILDKFKVGEKYPLNVIKSELKSIFEAFGYESSSKATALKDYFEVKEVRMNLVRCFEILSIKQ